MYIFNSSDFSFVLDAVFLNITKALEHKTAASPNTFTSLADVVPPLNHSNLQPFQQFLFPPPKQVVVVERMHSGARRFITLDFGKPILLTDIFIPSCSDLVTLTVDLWLKGEDIDETRLVVAMDIGSRNLLMADLQPPPLCRFMKVFKYLISLI